MASTTTAAPAWFPLKAPGTVKKLGDVTDGMGYSERLFHYAHASQRNDVHFMEYRLLQRINIFRLQNELANLKAAFWTNLEADDGKMDQLKTTLHDYATALRDYAYLKDMSRLKDSEAKDRRLDLAQAFPELASLPGDPFNSRYCTLASDAGPSSDPLRDFLRTYLPRRCTYTKSEKDKHLEEFLARQPPESISPFVEKLSRFILAFIGGASLVVPMLVMSLPTANRTKSLITVSLAVTIFAALMSLGFRATYAETLVATATYAAVLVVFVGTSI
ncbi:hypothetical protein EPUS_03400 [Endocarpon pusillum Z07020]|uniref:DUF6594 domain-containing protein n=1 Tax=Endocarpon pusillum (strain Z07020 / HMAS-L-300199) TaxID=1263415 RepID=U1HUB8_ENDPU|nr:uncharacterized protein EPUS_03400 [Endocarpon pusillum Z07020]ERF74210.1 hypothetical protein EPUS_03400 [Endocarpon pusillum Z07020]